MHEFVQSNECEGEAKVPDYLRWMLGADFGTEVKMHVRNALQGRFVERKQAA